MEWLLERNAEVISNNIANMRTTYAKAAGGISGPDHQQIRRAGSQTPETGTMVPVGVESVPACAPRHDPHHDTGDMIPTEKNDVAISGQGFCHPAPRWPHSYTRMAHSSAIQTGRW